MKSQCGGVWLSASSLQTSARCKNWKTFRKKAEHHKRLPLVYAERERRFPRMHCCERCPYTQQILMLSSLIVRAYFLQRASLRFRSDLFRLLVDVVTHTPPPPHTPPRHHGRVTVNPALLLQWQRREATEGQPALAEQGDQSGRQRRQPGGLRRRGRSVQRGRLLHRRVRRAKGKEGVLWDQSHRSDPSVRPLAAVLRPLGRVSIKPAGKKKWERSRHYPHKSGVKCNASLPSAHCHLHFTNSRFVTLLKEDHY